MPALHTFLIPDPEAFVSGGNRYNLELIQALREVGLSVNVRTWENWKPGPGEGLLWVDSLYLDQWAGLADKPEARLLVHHLPSLFSENEAADVAKDRTQLRHFSGFLCTSAFTAEYLVKLGFSQDQCLTVDPGAHLLPPRARGYADSLRGLIVANVIPRKGILPLLESLLSAAGAESSPWQLSIAGSEQLDVAYAQACGALVARHELLASRVHWLGELDEASMKAAYLSHNLLLSPAAMETYGMAIREGLCMGLPALVMEGGFAHRHLDGGQQGAIFSSSATMAAAFCQLSQHPDRLRALCEKQWQVKPTPISWKAQALSFIQQTETWQAKR